MAKEDFKFHHPIRVRWSECDLQAIVYNAVYLTWTEVAFSEYCRHLGFNLYRLAQLNLFDTVTATITIDYKSPARLDDVVDVYTRVANIGNTSIGIEFELYRHGYEQLLSRVEGVYVSYDSSEGHPRRVPNAIRQVFEHFEETKTKLSLEQFPIFASALNETAPD